MKNFNNNYSWEYNLLQNVRWGKEDAKEDVFFYVKKWIIKITKEEGYTITKKIKNDMRKNIDIKEEDVQPLKIMAVKANKDLKNYIQDLLSKHARGDSDII